VVETLVLREAVLAMLELVVTPVLVGPLATAEVLALLATLVLREAVLVVMLELVVTLVPVDPLETAEVLALPATLVLREAVLAVALELVVTLVPVDKEAILVRHPFPVRKWQVPSPKIAQASLEIARTVTPLLVLNSSQSW